MKILAFELSTRRAGVALMRNGALLDKESWEEPQARHQRLFDALPALMKRSGIHIRDIDVFAVGRGPGAFSGIRVAITAAQTLALPAGKIVYTASSGEALARAVLADPAVSRVAVVGDARRGTLWYGLFDNDAQVIPWSLTSAGRNRPRYPIRHDPRAARIGTGSNLCCSIARAGWSATGSPPRRASPVLCRLAWRRAAQRSGRTSLHAPASVTHCITTNCVHIRGEIACHDRG